MTDKIITIQDPTDLATLSAGLETFDQAAARFLSKRKITTRKNYALTLKSYRSLAADLGTDPLLADSIISFNADLNARRRDRGGNLANDTIRTRLNTIRSFFSWCYSYDLTPLKPGLVSDLITMPPSRRLSPRDVLTAEEAAALLVSAGVMRDPVRNRVLARCMLDAGLRVSEAIALTAGDIYAAGGRHFLHVPRGKGDRPRDVEIQSNLYADLCAYGQTDQRSADTPFFVITRLTAWRIVVKAAELADIPKRITPHSLRHTHAHFLRLAGWPLEAIAERLGHSQLDTTKKYTRPAELAMAIQLPVMPWAGHKDETKV